MQLDWCVPVQILNVILCREGQFGNERKMAHIWPRSTVGATTRSQACFTLNVSSVRVKGGFDLGLAETLCIQHESGIGGHKSFLVCVFLCVSGL